MNPAVSSNPFNGISYFLAILSTRTQDKPLIIPVANEIRRNNKGRVNSSINGCDISKENKKAIIRINTNGKILHGFFTAIFLKITKIIGIKI